MDPLITRISHVILIRLITETPQCCSKVKKNFAADRSENSAGGSRIVTDNLAMATHLAVGILLLSSVAIDQF